jgi:S1-C subfamily serine protease
MKPERRQFQIALLAVALLGSLAGWRINAGSLGQAKVTISPETRNLARQAALSVGLIFVRNANDSAQPRPRASAVVVSSTGLVVTNYHVITQDNSAKIFDELFINLSTGDFANGSTKRYRLRSLLVNPAQDLALLKIVADSAGKPLSSNASFPSLVLGDSNKVKLLDDIIIIGYPEKGGSTVTVNLGMVEGKDNLENWIKTDARLIHGNSGGAAINTEGKLIGIPTKVLADTRKIDKDGDGFPDEETPLGSVGFLRPANLIARMLEQASHADRATAKNIPSGGGATSSDDPRPQTQAPPPMPKTAPRPPVQMPSSSSATIVIRGVMRSAAGGNPIAGARVGIVPVGTDNVTTDNLLAWGSTKADGAFALNRAVPTGRYTLKARALGYEPFSQDIEITSNAKPIVIDLQKTR